MIRDPKIIQAVSSISQRAERQRDMSKVVSSYVEVGILPQLLNNNNQVLYGRRGTGKTHILKMFENRSVADKTKSVCYIDCRILGSSPQFSDVTLSISHRCSSLFIDILNEIYDVLLSHIAHEPTERAEQALNSLADLSESSIEEIQKSKKVIDKKGNTEQSSSSFGITITPASLDAKFGSDKGSSEAKEKTVEFYTEEYEKIIFPDLHYHLLQVLEFARTELIIVIDEWSAIPFDIQPFFAEFIKKSFIPIPLVTIKIGALEYRTNFSISRERHNYIGLELGSDISSNLDIDEYYVYDRNPSEIVNTFIDILLKHLSSELPEGYLEEKYGIRSSNQFLQSIFSGKPAFTELVRASEGVVRDFINIFNLAFFDIQRKGLPNIDKKTIIEAARQWFENDKSKNLDDALHSKLRLIIDEVIGKRRARSFLVSRELERHPTIQKLFDARVIHLVKKGYSDKDNPGIRYNIYTLDYGTYVDLINTTIEPNTDYIEEGEDFEDLVVPFDDKRSIRRIILTEANLI